MDKPLGKLEPVDLREYFADEARDFTRWLAQEENLKLLGETLGIDLELIRTEQDVEEFSADIVAKDPDTDEIVIIENQLEKTDHDHLGKLITYASGLKASTVVWISREIRQAHREAVDWLNEFSGRKVRFFALEVKLWRIGSSSPAPQFDVISEPNEWGSQIRETASAKTSESDQLRLKFWTEFADFCAERKTTLKLRKPTSDATYSISLGRTGIRVALRYRPKKEALLCGLYVETAESQEVFEQIMADKSELEKELGKLEWRRPTRDGARGRIDQRLAADLSLHDKWPDYFAWLKDRAEAFYEAFSGRIKALKEDDSES